MPQDTPRSMVRFTRCPPSSEWVPGGDIGGMRNTTLTLERKGDHRSKEIRTSQQKI